MRQLGGLILLLTALAHEGQAFMQAPTDHHTSGPSGSEARAEETPPEQATRAQSAIFERLLESLVAIPKRWKTIRPPLVPLSGRSPREIPSSSSQAETEKAKAWIEKLTQTPAEARPRLIATEIGNRPITEIDVWWPNMIAQELQFKSLEEAALVVEVWLQWAEAVGRKDALLYAATLGITFARLQLSVSEVLPTASAWAALPKEEGAERGWAYIQRALADLLSLQGKNKAALEPYRKARAVFQAVGDQRGLGNSLRGEADVLFILGDLQKALSAYRKARAAFLAAGDQIGQANTSRGEADVLFQLGEIQKALDGYRSARALFQAAGDKRGEGYSLEGEAKVLLLLGDNRKALDDFRKAGELFRAVGSQLGQGNALDGEGDVLHALGHYQKALDAFRKARTFFQAVGSPLSQGNTFQDEAHILLRLGDHQGALKAHREARTLFQASGNQIGQGYTFVGEAEVFLELGDHQRAFDAFRKSSFLFQKAEDFYGEGRALDGEARVLILQKKPQAAVAAASKAIQKYQKAGVINGEVLAFLVKAGAEEQAGEQRNAARSASEAIRLHAGQRKNQITDQHRIEWDETLVLAYDILIPWRSRQNNQTGEALRLAEEARSRVLLDLLGTGPGQEDRSAKVDLQAESTRLTATLAKMEERLAGAADPKERLELEAERRDLLQELEWNRYQRLASLDDPFPQSPPLGVAGIQQLARQAGPILLYYAARAEVWGLLVLPDQAEVLVREIALSRDELGQQVRSLTYDLANPLYESRAREKARTLWNQLIAPFAPELSAGRPVILVPHGPLHELPFEALLDPDGKPLFERWPVTVTPSASALDYGRKHHHSASPQDSFLAFSSGKGLNLPAEELAEISPFFSSNKAAFQPTEALFNTYKDLVAKARHVLIATRGVHVEGSRTETYLEIQPTREVHDSHLTSAEIASIPLDAELVTLAACDTSHGQALFSDERLDLTRAFLIAGAASVLATRWKVPEDTMTSQFLVDFYQAYRRGGPEGIGLRKDEALNVARKLSRERGDPAQVWAAWVLVGDGR